MSTTALDLDSLKNSHPIEVPIGHPDEIDEIFDDISYHKGAAIIRMLHNYIGDDVSTSSSTYLRIKELRLKGASTIIELNN